MMQAGLGVLRLSHKDFWHATPREIAAAFDTDRAGPLARVELDGLMQLFPDEP
jgi:uncharacterized phage protein (TIGR02216 family)